MTKKMWNVEERLGISEEAFDKKIAAGLDHCSCCDEWMPRSRFSKDRTRPRGIAPYCRMCYSDKYQIRRILQSRRLENNGAVTAAKEPQ